MSVNILNLSHHKFLLGQFFAAIPQLQGPRTWRDFPFLGENPADRLCLTFLGTDTQRYFMPGGNFSRQRVGHWRMKIPHRQEKWIVALDRKNKSEGRAERARHRIFFCHEFPGTQIPAVILDRKSTRLNSSHSSISY